MPIYEYQCQKCEGVFEILQGFNDKPAKKCEECGGRLKRLISVSAFHLKGSGWYETDYGKKKISEPKQLKDHDTGGEASSPAASSESPVLPTEQAAVSGSSQTYDSIKSDTKKAKSKQKKK
ncbi:MAG: zinc ribbon domain-containing protein [Candidatus Dadabacteria bacterium]|nr:zinc ribbon domain-containing protein [Candidatus Dadabacteria bacterium]MYA47705.1 zinc ribbon domain-containing protein [Candidatus Dadabacteria bacterium]MYF48396.1 zinc ribbon domain-containing protein [Candidatus Dadabacteria bacterium]MYK49805.1 zinc ribbon domain-containing protein [Candidatus Dadabacteria bacterium]